MTFLSKLLVLALLISCVYGSGVDFCTIAFNRCKFRFEGAKKLQTFSITGRSDVSFTSQIVSKDPKMHIGVVNSNRVTPEILRGPYFVIPVTSIPNGRLTPTQFKPYAIKYRVGSGIGHEVFQGFVPRRECVRVYLTNYQVLASENPPVINNVNLTPVQAVRQENCVVFRTA